MFISMFKDHFYIVYESPFMHVSSCLSSSWFSVSHSSELFISWGHWPFSCIDYRHLPPCQSSFHWIVAFDYANFQILIFQYFTLLFLYFEATGKPFLVFEMKEESGAGPVLVFTFKFPVYLEIVLMSECEV